MKSKYLYPGIRAWIFFWGSKANGSTIMAAVGYRTGNNPSVYSGIYAWSPVIHVTIGTIHVIWQGLDEQEKNWMWKQIWKGVGWEKGGLLFNFLNRLGWRTRWPHAFFTIQQAFVVIFNRANGRYQWNRLYRVLYWAYFAKGVTENVWRGGWNWKLIIWILWYQWEPWRSYNRVFFVLLRSLIDRVAWMAYLGHESWEILMQSNFPYAFIIMSFIKVEKVFITNYIFI